MIDFKPATPAHVEAIELRPEDSLEVSPGWRERLLADLENVMAAEDPEGTVVALFGVKAGEHELGPWLLCSAAVERHQATLLRTARRVVRSLRQDGRLVFNYIPKDSTGNRRFVERLGFRILPSPGDGMDLFYLPSHV